MVRGAPPQAVDGGVAPALRDAVAAQLVAQPRARPPGCLGQERGDSRPIPGLGHGAGPWPSPGI
eukprot:6562445-Alexandrium_andersonii.AAC.1